jgi:hypothetical protein
MENENMTLPIHCCYFIIYYVNFLLMFVCCVLFGRVYVCYLSVILLQYRCHRVKTHLQLNNNNNKKEIYMS